LKIAKAIIDLGKEMNVEVLAEGVETLEQLERMRIQGCHLIQGYYISKPMPADEVAGYLQFKDTEMTIYSCSAASTLSHLLEFIIPTR